MRKSLYGGRKLCLHILLMSDISFLNNNQYLFAYFLRSCLALLTGLFDVFDKVMVKMFPPIPVG